MPWMQARDRPIVFDSEVDLSAFRVRQTDYGGDQIAIGKRMPVALEFDRQ